MTRDKALETVLVLTLALLLASLWFNLSLLVYVAVGLLFVSLLLKPFAHAVAKVWMAFANLLSLVMNHLLLFAIFFFVLTPLALLQRLFGKSKFFNSAKSDSYFHKRNHQFSASDVDHLW